MLLQGESLWLTAIENLSAAVPAARSHINLPIGSTDDVLIVLNDNDGVAFIDEFAKHAEQDSDVLEMEPRGGFVKDIERAACVAATKFGSKFDTLTFASRKGVAGLSELDVSQTYFLQNLYFIKDDRLGGKEFDSLIDGHVEYVGNALASEAYLERFAIVALAATLFAGNIDTRQEVHFDCSVTVAATAFTSSAFDVERKAPWLVAADASFGEFDKEVTDVHEDASICGRIGARCSSERALVNINDLVD